jgi:predicted O-methyltransferase YrrM
MSRERWTEVDRVLTELFVPADPALEAAIDDSDASGLPSIQVSPPLGMLLHVLALATRARTILEIGTLGGYSTIWLARALPPDGRLITLEIDPKHADVARANLERAGVSQVVEIRLGRAQDTLPALAGEGRDFDLIFIDAEKPGYPEYHDWALRLSHVGTLIVADNVVRKGEVIDEASADPDVLGVRRYLELLAAEPRVRATTIQTVGGKGYDGFAIAVVTEDRAPSRAGDGAV